MNNQPKSEVDHLQTKLGSGIRTHEPHFDTIDTLMIHALHWLATLLLVTVLLEMSTIGKSAKKRVSCPHSHFVRVIFSNRVM